jgi:hypothetical protein
MMVMPGAELLVGQPPYLVILEKYFRWMCLSGHMLKGTSYVLFKTNFEQKHGLGLVLRETNYFSLQHFILSVIKPDSN